MSNKTKPKQTNKKKTKVDKKTKTDKKKPNQTVTPATETTGLLPPTSSSYSSFSSSTLPSLVAPPHLPLVVPPLPWREPQGDVQEDDPVDPNHWTSRSQWWSDLIWRIVSLVLGCSAFVIAYGTGAYRSADGTDVNKLQGTYCLFGVACIGYFVTGVLNRGQRDDANDEADDDANEDDDDDDDEVDPVISPQAEFYSKQARRVLGVLAGCFLMSFPFWLFHPAQDAALVTTVTGMGLVGFGLTGSSNSFDQRFF